VKALSAEEINVLAQEHVLRSIAKRKRVVASSLWPPELVIPTAEVGGERARINVVSRLYGAAVVRDAVAGLVESVHVAMGLDNKGREEKVAVGEGYENATLVKLKERREKTKAGESVQAPAAESEHSVELSDGDRVVEESEEFMGFSDTPEGAAAVATDDGEVVMGEDEVWERLMDPESTDFADFDNRIGASDSEDDGGDDIYNELERTDDEWSGSDADADDERDEAITSGTTSPPPPPPPPQKQKAPAAAPSKEKKPKAPAVTSQFLPSLMSGYVSGGDSDPDADWYKMQGKKKGPPEKKERKNRMGQQARRALWEKKFGKRANHVQKEEQEAREKRERKEAKAAKKASAVAGEKAQEGPLHPSWEAARKAKEKQAQVAAAMMKPQGKKITFN